MKAGLSGNSSQPVCKIPIMYLGTVVVETSQVLRDSF